MSSEDRRRLSQEMMDRIDAVVSGNDTQRSPEAEPRYIPRIHDGPLRFDDERDDLDGGDRPLVDGSEATTAFFDGVDFAMHRVVPRDYGAMDLGGNRFGQAEHVTIGLPSGEVLRDVRIESWSVNTRGDTSFSISPDGTFRGYVSRRTPSEGERALAEAFRPVYEAAGEIARSLTATFLRVSDEFHKLLFLGLAQPVRRVPFKRSKHWYGR